ncbi:MAG: nucleotidyltransferase family protein [Streptosporangiales bacterium]
MSAESQVKRLDALIRSSGWHMEVLRAARECALPDWLIGAGVLRDLVWGEMHDGFDPALVKDVDVAFFDPTDLTPVRDAAATAQLVRALPGINWEATNQAAVHLWYPDWFGDEVAPLVSAADGVATWPETATCVGARFLDDDGIEVVAPLGLDDLLDGVCRRNPRRVTVEQYRRRLQRKNIAERWPNVRIVDT